jgi:hypothetical protein
MDINAVVYGGEDAAAFQQLQSNASVNVKRVFHQQKDWLKSDAQDLYMIADTLELKTTWHPIENIGGATSMY